MLQKLGKARQLVLIALDLPSSIRELTKSSDYKMEGDRMMCWGMFFFREGWYEEY